MMSAVVNGKTYIYNTDHRAGRYVIRLFRRDDQIGHLDMDEEAQRQARGPEETVNILLDEQQIYNRTALLLCITVGCYVLKQLWPPEVL